MIDFPPQFQCQIHMHISELDGEIIASHIKSNNGDIRHHIYAMDAGLIFDYINDELHANGIIEMEQI